MIHLIAGLIVLVLGAWGIIAWWVDFGAILRGLIPPLLVLVGLAAVGAGLQKTRGAAEPEDEDLDEPNADTTPALERRNVA